jgi:glutathione peroxidase
MRTFLVIGIVVVVALVAFRYVRGITGVTVVAQASQPAVRVSALKGVVKDIDGKDFDLSQLKGKVVLIVNVASRCGFTRQYAGLEALYQKYKDKGLVVIGFPSNDFGGQEPGTEADIKAFCSATYGVTFPMMSKVVVKGEAKSPVYKALTEGSGPFAGEVGWNFTKFLISKDGETLLARFGSATKPDDAELVKAVEAAIGG